MYTTSQSAYGIVTCFEINEQKRNRKLKDTIVETRDTSKKTRDMKNMSSISEDNLASNIK